MCKSVTFKWHSTRAQSHSGSTDKSSGNLKSLLDPLPCYFFRSLCVCVCVYACLCACMYVSSLFLNSVNSQLTVLVPIIQEGPNQLLFVHQWKMEQNQIFGYMIHLPKLQFYTVRSQDRETDKHTQRKRDRQTHREYRD